MYVTCFSDEPVHLIDSSKANDFVAVGYLSSRVEVFHTHNLEVTKCYGGHCASDLRYRLIKIFRLCASCQNMFLNRLR